MLKKIINGTAGGICAGILISIGGAVFLSCENRYIGALLFSVALLCICYKGYPLFTGGVGFIPEKHRKEDVSALLLGLFGNLIGTLLGGWSLAYACPSMSVAARTLCDAKLTLPLPAVLIKGIFCGILMYLAVNIFREKGTPLGVVFCIPVFILSSFEHSVADMFYFAVSGIVSGRAFIFIAVVILGNSVGAMLLPLLRGGLSVRRAA